MSTLMMAQCWPLKMPPTPKAILVSLADNANDQGVCWPSLSKISERTCFGRTAVIEAIKWLEDAGALRADRSDRYRTTYILTPGSYSPKTGGDQGNQSGTQTSPPPVLVRQAENEVRLPDDEVRQPDFEVRQADTNRQEPSRTVIKSNRKKARAAAADPVVVLPPWLDPPLWESWVRDRRERGHPLTQGAAELSLASLTRLRAEGWAPKVVIENAIELGWRGLYAPKNGTNGGSHANRAAGSGGGVGDDVQRAIDQRNARAAGEQRGVVIEAAHAPGVTR